MTKARNTAGGLLGSRKKTGLGTSNPPPALLKEMKYLMKKPAISYAMGRMMSERKMMIFLPVNTCSGVKFAKKNSSTQRNKSMKRFSEYADGPNSGMNAPNALVASPIVVSGMKACIAV